MPACPDSREKKALLVWMVIPDCPVNVDYPDSMEQKENLVMMVLLAFPACQVFM